jgi:hypothetical protein
LYNNIVHTGALDVEIDRLLVLKGLKAGEVKMRERNPKCKVIVMRPKYRT